MESGDVEENQEECCENSDLSRSQILGKVSLRSSALAVDHAGKEKNDESPMVKIKILFLSSNCFTIRLTTGLNG
jgi:hypothetical protein